MWKYMFNFIKTPCHSKEEKSDSRKGISNILLFVVIIFSSLSLDQAFASDTKKKEIKNHDPAYYCKQFQNVLQRVEKDYIGEVDYQKMTDEAINGMLYSLDPYSGYFTDEDLEFFMEQTDGEFGG